MSTPAFTSLTAFEQGYVLGLLSLPHKSLSEMHTRGLLPYSLGYSAHLLAQDPLPYQWQERLEAAPQDGYLAVDLVTVAHPGASVEGAAQVYSSSDKGIIWGHSLLSSALIWQDKDPLPLRLEAFLTPAMATSTYQHFPPIRHIRSRRSRLRHERLFPGFAAASGAGL